MSARPSAPKRARSRRRFARTPIAGVVLSLFQGGVWSQDAAPAPDALRLRPSLVLRDSIGEPERRQMPTFISGDNLTGRPDLEAIIDGNAEVRRGDVTVRADRIEYYQPDDLATARGHVRVNRAGNIYEGTEARLKLDAFEGYFLQPRYQLLKNGGHGDAERIDFLDDKRAIIREASYTTCRREPGPSWLPDWVLRAASIRIDTDEDTGYATDVDLRFKGVPILPIPAMSFPLSDRRKSGVLPPTFGIDSVNGLELTLPYYWDIAPNRDATLYTSVMSKRGVDIGGEFRYLEPLYRGQARADFMPSDNLRGRARWGLTASHIGQLPTGWAGLGNLGVSVNLSRVSDDDYWRDFTRNGLSLTSRLLPNDGRLSWSQGDFFAEARALKWQTLQDVTAPIVPPYDRMPQLVGRFNRSRVAGGFDVAVEADHTRFEADPTLTLQPNADRSFVRAQISHPWLRSWGYVTPKLQVHATRYGFDAPLSNGATSASRVLPTFSLDAGLFFERDANYFGRGFRQTLEPRAFYVRTPYRDQSLLPNYDSGAFDFNFGTIYSENAYAGHDRIADANQLTLGVTSRLLDPATGAEAARFGIAQRFRFQDQRVTLPGEVAPGQGLSDILLGATLNWSPTWAFDGTVQFDPDAHRSVRTTLAGRYSPGPYRVFNAAYRLQRGQSEQLDLGWQWPINDLWGDRGQDLGAGQGQGAGRWYSVGRLNFSLVDGKLVDTIVGLEYDAGCWLARVVFERLQSSNTSASKRVLFQLEFVGFSRIGSNPLKTLRENIPRYQYLREQVLMPSRFSQYD